MKLNQISYFITVAEEKNVGRAAARLNISQPPLTRQIQQLELELGVKLFERHSGGMTLTDAGNLFLAEATNIMAVVDHSVDRTKRAGRGELGRLDIGVFGSGILGTIPQIILYFRNKHPGVEVALHSMTKEQQLHSLRNRTIGVAFNRMLEIQPDMVAECIAMEDLYLAVNTADPLARIDSVKFADLRNENFILFPTVGRPGFIEKVRGICHEFNFFPRVAQEVGDVVSGVALVASGFGVCIVPASATVLAVPNVIYKPVVDLPETARVDLSCIYMEGEKSPILERFLESMHAFLSMQKNRQVLSDAAKN